MPDCMRSSSIFGPAGWLSIRPDTETRQLQWKGTPPECESGQAETAKRGRIGCSRTLRIRRRETRTTGRRCWCGSHRGRCTSSTSRRRASRTMTGCTGTAPNATCAANKLIWTEPSRARRENRATNGVGRNTRVLRTGSRTTSDPTTKTCQRQH